MSYKPLHHKYRPQTFGDLVGQSAIAQTLINAIQQEKIAPAYLFTGPRGTGKTSSARILAKSLNCLKINRPTPNPCGECEVCQAIASGTALDIIEIDAASNTGVDNIREIIERSQFAPVQSRYKVYCIDECLTGDSLIQTNSGLMRIDNPNLKGQLVLSYNERTEAWEYKKVLRWLERGTKETLIIRTSNYVIRCTKNHLIRTDRGWIRAENVKEGMKILSPGDVEKLSTNTAQMEEFADFHQDIKLRAINTEANPIILKKFLNNLDLYTEPYWEMEASNTQTHIVDFPDYAGHTEKNKKNGLITKPAVYNSCVQKYKKLSIEDTAKNQLFVTQPVTPNYKKFIKLLNQIIREKLFHGNGLDLLRQKVLRGGIWMTVLYNLLQKEVLPYFFTLKGFLNQKIKSLLIGSQIWDILPLQNLTLENPQEKPTITSSLEQNLVENGYQICNNIRSPQWNTNLEKVEFVLQGDREKVYDLEVEDNHNFVANGLLVHNCHMLSTAAFNALLKTLEEPPPRVVFILATTDPQRVLPTIISRCQRFDYRRIPLEEMVNHLSYISQQENINIDLEAIRLVSQIANGGLRDAESLLDQLSLFPEKITIDQVWDLVGAIPERDLLNLLQEIRTKNFAEVLSQCRNLLDRGREPITVLQNLASFYLNLLIAQSAPQSSNLVAVTEDCWAKLKEEATQWQQEKILWGQQKLKEAEIQIKNTTQPRLWLEVTLLGLLSDLPQPGKVTEASEITIKKENNTSLKTQPLAKQDIQKEQVIESQQESPIAKKTVSFLNHSVSDSPPPIPSETPTSNKVVPITKNKPIVENLVKSKPSVSEIDTQEIWQNAIAIIEPLATRSLLTQKCHLIALEDSRAIIGINAPALLRLLQGKASNIEAAFTKVCQRTIKVTIEIASDGMNPPTTEVSSPLPKVKETSESKFPPVEVEKAEEVKGVEEQPKSNISVTQTPIFKSPPPAENINTSVINDRDSQVEISTSISSEDDFTKAVELITKNFDGEIITLDRYSNDNELEDSESSIEEITQIEEVISSNPNIDDDPSIKDGECVPKNIIANRPDSSQYDDDDIPF